MNQSNEEEFLNEWQRYLEEISSRLEEAVKAEAQESVQDLYEDILMQNLENTKLSTLPEEAREELAEMGARVYAEQAERILDSTYLETDELETAVATAFLDTKKQIKIGAQARGLASSHHQEMENPPYTEEQYREWTTAALINPQPPHQLTEDWESVDRFKPPEEDPTYQ
ncbi:MAG: hypothetical protein ABEK00_01315 [Candidatus Nanohaloarchaea archaeon]